MKVIPPVVITDAMLTSSTAAEPGIGEVAWTSGATFALGEQAILGVPTATVTITNASPAVVTWTAHSLPNGTMVSFTTTGALPTGLTVGTAYYVVAALVNTFQVSETLDGIPVATTSVGSGTHTGLAYIHRVYTSLQAGNTGHHPLLAASSTWWIDSGPTNKWAMFDLLRNTKTIQASPLTTVFAPGQRIDSIALLGLVASSLTISATSVQGGGAVYSETVSLSTRNVLDWYSYFFEPFSFNPSIIRFSIPPYSDIIVTITLTATSGNVQCGACVVGTNVLLGSAETGAVADLTNFSTIERDSFGNATLIPRRNVPKTTQKVFMDKFRVNKVLEIRDALNAVPAVFSGVDDVDDEYANALLILGIIRSAPISMDFPDYAVMNLELEEV